MATTDELLAEAEATSDTTETNYIIVDNDLRTLTIPESITLLGVESDDRVNNLYFKMPCTYGEYDLSTFAIRINYMNANNQGDQYAVDDKTTDGEYMYFSWEVGSIATAYKGTTKFIVCLRLFDKNANVIKQFNTTLANLPVLEGLETTEAVVSKNADIIEQILAKIEGFTEITTDDIQTAVDNYLTENPVSGKVSSDAIEEAITNYFIENPIEGTSTTVTQTLTSGIEIARINGIAIYAPSYTDGDEESY